MIIYDLSNRLEAPLTELAHDWHGKGLDPAVSYSFAFAEGKFIFRAGRDAPARVHPDARSGRFQPELWRYDVAEFFLADPVTAHYLEFNLAPNGAHWCCEFRAPRVALAEVREAGIASGGVSGPQGWTAWASMPIAWLRQHLHFGAESRINATFILDSPRQRFLTAVPLGPGEPDFHRPGKFAAYSRRSV